MIISASRRTDIPALYGDWFEARIKAGYALVRNPFNAAQTRRVSLLPEDVDGCVFWTKNPAPFLERLDLIRDIPTYFHVTMTSLGSVLEPHVPPTEEVVLPAALEIVRQLGRRGLVWRFDPMVSLEGKGELLTRFTRLAAQLEGATDECVISFLAPYRAARKRLAHLALYPGTVLEQQEAAGELFAIGRKHGIRVRICCAEVRTQLPPAVCIDAERLSAIAGSHIKAVKDRGQRPACRCAASTDIGAYGTCTHGCLYCYAARGSFSLAEKRYSAHDPQGESLDSQKKVARAGAG